MRALCDAADEDAFSAVSSEQLSDQNTPTFILQLGSIVQATVELAVTENVLYLNRLMPQANWERIGRYARISGEQGAGVWLGIHFGLWKAYGGTPLWLIFLQGEFGRAQEVRPLVEPWAVREGFHTVTSNDDFAIALDIPAGEDKAAVIRSLVKDLSKIATVLRALPPSSNAVMEQE